MVMHNSQVFKTPLNQTVNGVKQAAESDRGDQVCDKTVSRTVITRLANGVPTTRHPLDTRDDSLYSDDSGGSTSPIGQTVNLIGGPISLLGTSKTTSNPIEVSDAPTVDAAGKSPDAVSSPGAVILSDEDEDRSLFQAVLSPDCRDVRLMRDGTANVRRRIPLPDEYLHKSRFKRDVSSYAKRVRVGNVVSGIGGSGVDPGNREMVDSGGESCGESASTDGTLDDNSLSPSLESLDEIEDSILGSPRCDDPAHGEDLRIPELTAQEEAEDARRWRTVTVTGVEKRIDMSVIEPYKRVLSHGGYLEEGSRNAIIVFGACFLPHRSRLDYAYVMENLFYYIVSTLDDLVTDDYVLVYLHGGAAKDVVPKFSWLKRCYQMIDRRLRKNLRRLYLVHPTFWLRTIVAMTRPFVSSKFARKVTFVESLAELFDTLPLEGASVPDRVHQYDRIKQSVRPSKK